jgi:hypothetical protein
MGMSFFIYAHFFQEHNLGVKHALGVVVFDGSYINLLTHSNALLFPDVP